MKLDNETLLGSYLAHLHSNVRNMAKLEFERANHPDAIGRPPPPVTEHRKAIMEEWDKLRTMLWDLLELKLKSFGELAQNGPCHLHTNEGVEGPRCLRYNFAKLKKMADKHRRKHPEFTLLGSWDLEARKRTEEEKAERSEDWRFQRGF